MDNETIKDLKSLSNTFKLLAYLTPIAIIGLTYVIIIPTFADENTSVAYYIVFAILSVASALRLYAKSLNYAFKASLLEKVSLIEERGAKQDESSSIYNN